MPNGGTLGEKWPTDLAQDGHCALNVCKSIVSAIEESIRMPNSLGLAAIQKKITEAKKLLRPLTTTLSTAIDDAYGNGSSTSKPFRTFMAERMAIFPTESLDATNNAIEVLQQTENWTESAVGKLGFHQVFILTGDGGSGKTHGICDMALRRLSDGSYSCVLFGHQFGNEPVDWERFSRELGLSATLKRDTIWDALDAAAEASGKPLIVWIDAINETKPRKYWKERLKGFAAELCRRPNLKLCVSCRTTFERACIPTHHDFPIFKHNGFRGLERKACREFFGYYGLTSPVTPLLQPELVNPLYLKLVCETLRARGMKYLPPGWHGLAPVITAFLETKDEQFADEHELSPSAKIVSRGLHAVASAIASSNGISLLWPDAEAAVATQVPNANQLKLLDWMIRADLLIEDELIGENIEVEVVLRPAFERLGDFLIASGMIPAMRPESIQDYFDGSTPLQTVFRSSESIIKEPGLVAALSVVLAERYGVELPMLIRDENVKLQVRTMSVEALPWRTPLSFNSATKRMLNEQFAIDGFVAMEAVLSVSTLPSVIDIYWILRMHSQSRISQRDPFWCDFVYQSFVDSGVVKSLIVAADDLPFEEMNTDIALRWSIILCLFTVAADRRIKDGSTRALTQIFKHCPSVIESTLTSVKSIDDDDITERALTAAYGALLINKNRNVMRSIAGSLLSQYQADPSAHQHALIRDLIRCIGEMAEHFECLPEGIIPSAPSTRQRTHWKPRMPTEHEWKLWCEGSGALYKAAQSCADNDFNHYTISCLSPWIHKMNKVEIGQWLVKHLVEEFDFDSPDFDYYDQKMVREQGGGRSKPVWAERIGKKYQWTALFRLASRLHDKFPVKADSWSPKTVRRPLILQEERKIDPTIPNPAPPRKESKDCWWIPAQVNLAATEHLSFKEWLGVKDDLPTMEDWLSTVRQGEQNWRLLHATIDWGGRAEDADYDTPYRNTWMHLRPFLVPAKQFKKALGAISGRNYFEGWLPEGGGWLHCFLGEYPWATPFNTEPDWYNGAGTKLRDTGITLIHASNEVNCEWQYDGTLDKSLQIKVPAKQFFIQNGLEWNGNDGFSYPSGRTVFRDPHASEGGKSALIVDADELPKILHKLGYRLLWTLLGEKWVLGQRHDEERLQSFIYSQTAYLEEDGTVNIGKRRFDTDYGCDAGPAPAYLKQEKHPLVEYTHNSIRINK